MTSHVDASKEMAVAVADPFGIDGPEFTDRDRLMFVLGYEFRMAWKYAGSRACRILHMAIHAENEPRIRSMCKDYGRRCEITPLSDGRCNLAIHPFDD